MSQLEEQLESIPGYDIAIDTYTEWAGDRFNSTNPFEDDERNKRVLNRQKNTEKERRVWRQIQKTAWVHDKCFLGSCGLGLDCGVGLVPVAVFFLPGLGAILTYVIHARLISLAQNQLYLPGKLVAKLQTNILIDFLISLPPVVGALLAWVNGCLTRNAGMLYVYLDSLGEKRLQGQAAVYMGPSHGKQMVGPIFLPEPGSAGGNLNIKSETKSATKAWKKLAKRGPESPLVVGIQESGVR
ncbi:hypothetical protein METBIDRAFT_91615 [Metschnikowia bicuspidata var. bicuspidata NRRL YB-4993]|uniref:Uncharacterized protein n=1 Tax=Metschnikowia bicuspidata var. bicuspidata NRRL YB-4993 TaxID=869754 RepID=A0A1A0HFG5_9ASCO|nr:hypothetical protein METBIDRAFT_91615 [Metschnikowia bicuspidata var. bicuspidata NRRL YB-4993]OBA22741.1 hypothetical protein METBIDRAFT_91615 [Metschnikowia bicuspidata var. bicuspidata NRRL YB-4993]